MTSREPREMYGTKTKTEQTAHAWAPRYAYTWHGTRYTWHARGWYAARNPYVQCVGPEGKLPCASETYGTHVSAWARTSASQPPRSGTTSTRMSEGMTRSTDQTEKICRRILVRMCGVPAQSSVSISPFGVFHPLP